jgi:cysteine sulfinate desulfinase/cysteine desulfurase-like protein
MDNAIQLPITSITSYLAKRTICLPQPIRQDVTVLGGMDAVKAFEKLGTKVKDMKDCLRRACNSQKGNIAFMSNTDCFSFSCHKLHECELEPKLNDEVKTAGALYRIIGKPGII